MMLRKKDLRAQIDQLHEENTRLRRTESEHMELEEFLGWMEAHCRKEKAQFCGIKKITLDSATQRTAYVGFVLYNHSFLQSKSRTRFYTIEGYLSIHCRSGHPDYTACVRQVLSQVPVGVTNRLFLDESHVKEGCEGIGIGSAGMTAIKDLAKQLHCSVIEGQKCPDPGYGRGNENA